ncbi:hypothetical protein GGX14DRAFT_392008 [Mycena pura]|uniref:Uncharacterized protein n=1 Tax=Mycena pura TaxID=153505 RepID=A0AAD6VKI2_9AGAR|nr:hypothetical protein GGX14DRAFT_392008 [Mycena pura]
MLSNHTLALPLIVPVGDLRSASQLLYSVPIVYNKLLSESTAPKGTHPLSPKHSTAPDRCKTLPPERKALPIVHFLAVVYLPSSPYSAVALHTRCWPSCLPRFAFVPDVESTAEEVRSIPEFDRKGETDKESGRWGKPWTRGVKKRGREGRVARSREAHLHGHSGSLKKYRAYLSSSEKRLGNSITQGSGARGSLATCSLWSAGFTGRRCDGGLGKRSVIFGTVYKCNKTPV